MEISHSKAATARGCWKKYEWKYVHNLEPIKQSNALTIGRTIHEGFERFYKGASNTEVHAFIEKEFDEALSMADLVDQEDLLIAKYTTLGMWDFYPHKTLGTFQAINPEVEFRVRIGNTRDYFVGHIDGHVVYDNKNWVREMKTTGLNHRQFMGRMKSSSQVTGYVYASNKTGFQVAGVMFDVIKKPALRKRDSENADQFGKRIYVDYGARPDEYYMRHYEYRNPEIIGLFEDDLISFAKDLRAHTRNNNFYRNHEQCWNFNSECPYMKICFSKQPDALTLELLYKEGDHGKIIVGSDNGSEG